MALLDRLKLRTDAPDSENELLTEILLEAVEAYIDYRFPNASPKPSASIERVEPEYEGIVLLMAIDIYNKIGSEGERGHSENGISRTYSGDWISKDLLARIVPYCGVVS